VPAPQLALSRFWKQLLPDISQEDFRQMNNPADYTLRRIVYLKPLTTDSISSSRAWKFNSPSISVRLSILINCQIKKFQRLVFLVMLAAL
jgi:hypothetical protein